MQTIEERFQFFEEKNRKALETMKKGWSNCLEDVVVYIATNQMLVAVSDYDEGEIDTVDSMELFKYSGMAKARERRRICASPFVCLLHLEPPDSPSIP